MPTEVRILLPPLSDLGVRLDDCRRYYPACSLIGATVRPSFLFRDRLDDRCPYYPVAARVGRRGTIAAPTTPLQLSALLSYSAIIEMIASSYYLRAVCLGQLPGRCAPFGVGSVLEWRREGLLLL